MTKKIVGTRDLRSIPQVAVTVTRERIDQATQRDSGHCMIADAVRDAVPDASAISVDLQTIRWTDSAKGLRYIYLTPRVAQVALVKFDQGIPTEPFSFRVRSGQILKSGRTKYQPQELGTARDHHIPDRIGGTAPPLAALSNSAHAVTNLPVSSVDSELGDGAPEQGPKKHAAPTYAKRRAYGLRALEF